MKINEPKPGQMIYTTMCSAFPRITAVRFLDRCGPKLRHVRIQTRLGDIVVKKDGLGKWEMSPELAVINKIVMWFEVARYHLSYRGGQEIPWNALRVLSTLLELAKRMGIRDAFGDEQWARRIRRQERRRIQEHPPKS